MRWLGGIPDSMDMNLGKLLERVEGRGAWLLQSVGSQKVRDDLVTEQQCISVKHYVNSFDITDQFMY